MILVETKFFCAGSDSPLPQLPYRHCDALSVSCSRSSGSDGSCCTKKTETLQNCRNQLKALSATRYLVARWRSRKLMHRGAWLEAHSWIAVEDSSWVTVNLFVCGCKPTGAPGAGRLVNAVIGSLFLLDHCHLRYLDSSTRI